jgi:poly(hydroxyalkanoate) depolymerase family esterase
MRLHHGCPDSSEINRPAPPWRESRRIRAATYIPTRLSISPPLVVVLHGSTQSGEDYDSGTGWSTLADQLGIVLLFPEQRRANNAGRGFNWFERNNTQRDMGEAVSIRHLVEQMVQQHSIDRARIFITGMSAGCAMTSVMLAAYRDVFAGGAIFPSSGRPVADCRMPPPNDHSVDHWN